MDGFCYFNGSAMYIFVREDYSEPNFEASAVSGILGLRTPDYKGALRSIVGDPEAFRSRFLRKPAHS